MIVDLAVMVIASLLMAAAFVAANGDIHLTQTDTNGKKAYYAAQAGISQYVYHLNQDINYWTYCTEGSAASNHALNQAARPQQGPRAGCQRRGICDPAAAGNHQQGSRTQVQQGKSGVEA